MKTQADVVMTTFPNGEVARRILDGLLERRLAACAQTMPIESAYRWKGEIRREPEVLALIKTDAALWPEVEAYLRERHPYETPEILRLPVAGGAAGYLEWIAGETGGGP